MGHPNISWFRWWCLIADVAARYRGGVSSVVLLAVLSRRIDWEMLVRVWHRVLVALLDRRKVLRRGVAGGV